MSKIGATSQLDSMDTGYTVLIVASLVASTILLMFLTKNVYDTNSLMVVKGKVSYTNGYLAETSYCCIKTSID